MSIHVHVHVYRYCKFYFTTSDIYMYTLYMHRFRGGSRILSGGGEALSTEDYTLRVSYSSRSLVQLNDRRCRL